MSDQTTLPKEPSRDQPDFNEKYTAYLKAKYEHEKKIKETEEAKKFFNLGASFVDYFNGED